MSDFLEQIYTMISQGYEWLKSMLSALSSLGSTVSNSFHYMTSAVLTLPDSVAVVALLVIALAVLFFVLGR